MKLLRSLGALALLLPCVANAAPPEVLERGATDGVERVYEDYSAEGDASSLELNPAMLSAIRGLDLTLLGYQTTDRFMRGSGFGAFAAFNLGFGVAMGFGAQLLEPGLGEGVTDFDADANPTATKLSWGLSLGRSEYGSFGVGVSGLRSQGQWLQRPDVDVGLMSRITNYASVGAMVRMSPVNIDSETLPPELSVVGELSVRPLGTKWSSSPAASGSRSSHGSPEDARCVRAPTPCSPAGGCRCDGKAGRCAARSSRCGSPSSTRLASRRCARPRGCGARCP